MIFYFTLPKKGILNSIKNRLSRRKSTKSAKSLNLSNDANSSSNADLNSIEIMLDSESSKEEKQSKTCLELGHKKHKKEEPIIHTLTSDQVKYLDLTPGRNEIMYSINRGAKKISAFIYLWDYSDKLIICDIDGTVTKSDFRGQVLQFMGRNWAQEGVAGLFSSLHARGYQIVYLTARSFVMSNITHYLLGNINEDGCMMPIGPIFMNPWGLIKSIHAELVRKTSHLYKIGMLTTIKSLFDESHQPLYAGFGNKSADANAYRTAGIRDMLIFITDYAGSINCVKRLPPYLSYKVLHNFINIYFPPNNVSDKNEATLVCPKLII